MPHPGGTFLTRYRSNDRTVPKDAPLDNNGSNRPIRILAIDANMSPAEQTAGHIHPTCAPIQDNRNHSQTIHHGCNTLKTSFYQSRTRTTEPKTTLDSNIISDNLNLFGPKSAIFSNLFNKNVENFKFLALQVESVLGKL